MKIAIVGAGFTPAEADNLRRAMATFKRTGAVHAFREKFLDGMRRNGYRADFAESCFQQIEGFGNYGFPESHAASFALLVYVSAWLKRHHPAAFACALLNSQPMGFYAPAQIVQDAQRHGVQVRPVDINASDWDNTLEPFTRPGGKRDVALRLGFRQIKGLSGSAAGVGVQAILAARVRPYLDPADVWHRSHVAPAVLEKLAEADVFASLGLSRRDALWAVKPLKAAPLPLFAAADARAGTREEDGEPAVRLPDLLPGEQVVEDYATLRLTLREHPMALLRPEFARERLTPAARLAEIRDGARVTVAGLAVCRQRPGTASGVIFITLEDETGVANLVVWPKVFETQRREVLRGRLLAAEGRVQKEGLVIHVVVDRLRDLTGALRALSPDARALRPVSAHADRIKHNHGP